MPAGHRSGTILPAWAAATLLSMGCAQEASIDQASYVGGASCVGCHQEESTAWTGSHHDLAMQVASAETVLGDFSGVTFAYYGRTSTFFTRADSYFVSTEGRDGELHDYQIAYTFGASPPPAVSHSVSRRRAPGARHRLGCASRLRGRTALVPSLSG